MAPIHPQPVALLALLRNRQGRTEVLLGRKRRGFGQGKIVLPGGKIEPGETAAEAAIREFHEETRLLVQAADLELGARVDFRFPAQPAADMDCTAFIASTACGEPGITEELEPLWADPASLPAAQMWQDSPLWLPRLVAGEKFSVEVVLAPDNQSVERLSFRDRD